MLAPTHNWPEEDLLVCRGKEFAGRGVAGRPDSALHVPGLFIVQNPPAPAGKTLQEYLNWVADPLHSYVADGFGGLPIVAHPFMGRGHTGAPHLNKPRIEPLEGLAGIEIAHHGNCGLADRLWDELMIGRCRAGKPLVWGFGADDSHSTEEGRFCLSWTAVKVRRRNTWELKRSMREGAHYVTNGLREIDVRAEGREIVVTCAEPVEVRWLKAGQYYDAFLLERMTRHGEKVKIENVTVETALTAVHPLVSAEPGPNRCLRADRGVTESVYRLDAADGTADGTALYVRCVLLRMADLAAFEAAVRDGTRVQPTTRPADRPAIVKAFVMPVRVGRDGRLESQYPVRGTWVTGVTHNHSDLMPDRVDRASEYFARYRRAGHLASFETGYSNIAVPYLHYPPGVTPRVASVRPGHATAGRPLELDIAGECFDADAQVLIAGRPVPPVAPAARSSLRVAVPADFPPGVHDVTVRNPGTPYQHTLCEALVLRPAPAHTAGWTAYGVEHGLPDPDVYCLLRTPDGLLAGTNGGVARFDGRGWHADPAGPVVAASMAADRAGNLWVCGYGGVFRRDPAGSWQGYGERDGLKRPRPLQAVFCASDGTVYVCANGPAQIARLDGAGWVQEHVPGKWGEYAPISFAENPAGEIWAGVSKGAPLKRSRTEPAWSNLDIPALPDGAAPRLFRFGADGAVVAATAASEDEPRGGVCLLRNGAWRVFNQAHGLPHHRVWDIACAPDGSIWAASCHGLARIGPDGELRVFTALNSGLASDSVNALLIERETLWIATDKGVCAAELAHI